MKLKRLPQRAMLTLPSGEQVEVERIGKGRFTTAWRNSHYVYLQVNEADLSKQLLMSLSRHGNPHIPELTHLEDSWYREPLYRPLTATKSGDAWKQYRYLAKLAETCYRDAVRKPWGTRTTAHEDATKAKQLLEDALQTEDSVKQLPATLREAVYDIINETYNYGAYWLEFSKRNLAVDSVGTLILLDPVFDLEYIRKQHASVGVPNFNRR